jgi:ATP-binding cassette subfamily F protein 3
VLILDEPTNHLDIPAREALEAALDEYDGTIITVSHDRFFLDRIASQILAFNGDGRVDTYYGNYSEYHDWWERKSTGKTGRSATEIEQDHRSRDEQVEYVQLSKAEPSNAPERSDEGDSSIAPKRSDSAPVLSKNQRIRLESRVKEIENIISELEDEAAKLTLEMATPQVAGDFARLSELTRRHEELEAKIKSLYAEWEQAAEALA